FKERALPDLGKNIQCGNSLIGPDYFEGHMFPDEEERYRVNAFNWQAAFPQIFIAGGFDAVIGNPPYVVLSEGNFSEVELKYLGHYFVAQYRTDLFHVFIQKGIDLLRTSGHIGFITPNTWFTLKNSSKLREYVLKNSLVTELVVFSHKVFEDANVHTGLFFSQNGKASKEHQIAIKHFPASFTPDSLLQPPTSHASQSSWLSGSDFVFETRQTGLAGEFVHKIKQTFPRLEEVARASLGCQAYNSSKHTQEQIRNRVFHASEKLSNEYLPELAGSDVGRYLIDRKRGEWIKYGPWLHDYRTMDWLTGPRLLIREIPGKAPYRICACYIEETYCNYKTILNVNPSQATTISMKYLLGILNSKLISYLYPLVSDKMVAETFPRLTVRDLKNLPIHPINFSNPSEKAAHDKLVSLVERMLALHKRSARTPQEKEMIRREVESTDRAIDALVNQLYGLTEEEIKIVEGG
ncbi:MAG: Eco57I restriction-modification methylase domain-containing protein, partial [Thermoplasmata archaeon]|nr:Eco57I restriction-modification methylase domain-containing protein [Thermoplasmata archaeon]